MIEFSISKDYHIDVRFFSIIFVVMRISRGTLAFIVGGVSLGAYIICLAPTVGLVDSGELALACAEPGIAHPTGYPLYTVLGRVLLTLTGLEPVLATNLLSALTGTLAVALMFLLIRYLIDGFIEKRPRVKDLLALGLALAFGFSRTFSAVSVVTEVYSLELALDLAAFYLLLLWFHGENRSALLGSAYLFGLSFGVHMMSVLFFPAIISVFIFERKRLELKIVLFAALFFIIGLSVYFYLPIRASQSPVSNFGDPSSWERFIRHITGWQYRVWMFSRPGTELVRSVCDFAVRLSGEMTFVAVPFALIGLVRSFFKVRKLAVVFLLVFMADIIYALNYSIPDIEPYFLPALVVTAIWVSFGVSAIFESRRFWFVVLPIIGYFPVAGAALNLPETCRRDYYLAEETATNILALAPRNSVIYLNNWDWYAPAVYLQRARGYRPDLTLLDFELMRRSWYLHGKLERHPTTLGLAKTEIEDFISSVIDFERGENIDPAILENKWRTMHRAITTKNLRYGRPVGGTFYYGEMAGLWQNAPLRPIGVLRFVVSTKAPMRYIPSGLFDIEEFQSRSENLSQRELTLTSLYKYAWLERATILYKQGELERSASYLNLIVRCFPDDLNAWQNLATIRIEQERYEEAIEIFRGIEHLLPPGSNSTMIYNDLNRRIALRDSMIMQTADSLGEID